MVLNKFSDYALRILIYIASGEGEKATAEEIATRFDISFHHIAKAAQWLTAKGYLSATRGRSGGLMLARPADQINIGDLLRALESSSALLECFKADGGSCRVTPVCSLKLALAQAQTAFYTSLERHNLSDMTPKRSALSELLRPYA